MAYRSTRRHQPKKDDTLVSSPEQARKIIADLDAKLKTKLKDQERATYLCARAVLYEALGDQEMLVAAEAAFKFSKTAQSCALVAVALHHFGRVKEALQFYEQAYRFPHEHGFEVDIGRVQGIYFGDDWSKAWPIVLALRKRMVYAAFLPTWDGKPCKEVQVISEGGHGDIMQMSRYLPLIKERGVEKVTVFLPAFFFDAGLVDLMRYQDWCPEIKILTDARPNVPSLGFFDMPAVFQSHRSTAPPPLPWGVPNSGTIVPKMGTSGGKPKVGFCWTARAMEVPICPDGVYRSLTEQQAVRIVQQTSDKIDWVSLQHNPSTNLGIYQPELKSWVDTAAVIDQLDAIVCVDTAVAHLGSGMNKPVHLLLSGAVDHKYGLSGTKCSWYPTMTLYRNEDFGFENTVANFIDTANKGCLTNG